MLDHLKTDRHAGFGAQERIRLSLYVAGMLVLGGVIVISTTWEGKAAKEGQPAGASASAGNGQAAEAPKGPVLDPAELNRRVEASQSEPDRFSAPGIEYVLDVARRGTLGEGRERLTPKELGTLDPAAARGRLVELGGRVTDRTREEYRPNPDSTGNERLWSIILQGADGSQVVALKYGNRTDRNEGAPVDAKPPNVRADLIETGQHVLVRGVYLQQRTGTLGQTVLRKPTPVILARAFRIVPPPEERLPVISSLEEALWSEVADRFNRESRNLVEPTLFEVVQWARAQGYEACRDAILEGDLGWKAWGTQTFETWKKEVAVGRDDPRPFTEGARGKVFRTSGIVSEVLHYGWERMPRNQWGVEDFQILTLHSDYYQSVALRLVLPFPISTFPDVKGEYLEHLRIYGVFVKNLTYDTQFDDEKRPGLSRPITVPMFVVLHAEQHPEDVSARQMYRLMLWVAGAMVLLGVIFYLVLIRGGRKQAQRMEAHRFALRKRARSGRLVKGGEPESGSRTRSEDASGDEAGASDDG